MTNNVNEYQVSAIAAIDARADYETAKNADNDSIAKHFNVLRKSVNVAVVAERMMLCNVNADYINRQERSNNRYNVYAALKVDNAICASLNSVALNHYSLAILRAALALEANELTLTHKDAVAACSESVKHSDSKREKIIKSVRYAKHVAANTASTQSSSSINALQTCNVLTETRDASNVICYSVNRDSEMTKLLAARYELAL